MPHYRLISDELCPYVQRSVITLLEKKVPFDVEYIDLKNKPAWFLELAPLGKVPTLEVTADDGEKIVLFESVVINEYLDEVTEGSMLPRAPLPRARARAWIQFANELLVDVFYVMSAKDEASLGVSQAKLDTKLDRLESELGEGPYFLGANMSLVDTTFASALQRLAWCNELYPELQSFSSRPKLARWWHALAERESVVKSVVADARARFDAYVGRDRGGYRSVVGRRVAS